ncbi:MAG: Gfo/Idh/MocA family protein [Trueperaceae bacterium]
MNLAVIGCGNIAGPYSKDIKKHPSMNLLGFSDIDVSRAETFAKEHGGKAYASLEEVLADPTVEVIVNLTIFQAHYEVIKKALLAGKHVYTEKPLTLVYAEAKELLELAKEKGLYLGGAPITFLGEAQQSAMKYIQDGKLGQVRVVYAEVNHGRIESWHPNPAPFYAVGPNLDVGVYPLAFVTALFGPAKRLTAFATTLSPNRVTKDGQPFTVEAPDFYVVNIEFPKGQLVRLTTNFYVSGSTRQGESLEFHGDIGSLYLESWFIANSKLHYADFGKPYKSLALVKDTDVGMDWAVGLQDFTDSIRAKKTSRVTGDHAAHVVEILEATNTSVKTGKSVELTSTFTVPASIF